MVLGCPIVGVRAAAFNGDPASLARDNIYLIQPGCCLAIENALAHEHAYPG